MIRKIDAFLAILAALAVILANTAMGFAENSADFEDDVMAMESAQTAIENIQNDPEAEKANEQAFYSRIKQEFNLNKSDYQQLLNRIIDTQDRLIEVENEKVTLNQQMQNLDIHIELTTQKLLNVIKQVVETENAITLLYEDIEMRKIALNYQQELLQDYIRVIYQEENEYFSFEEDGGVNAFKLLLADGTVGENLKEIEYFDLLNEAGQQMVEKLDKLADELEAYQAELNVKREHLIVLQAGLEADKEQLEVQKQAKEKLLDLTLGQEQIYQQLLEQTLNEQQQMITEIQDLNEAMLVIGDKIKNGESFDPADYEDIFDEKTQALYEFQFNYDGATNRFSWPVEPERGVSAYFRDSGYVGVFGVQHNAIDIPIYQGSPVHSTADGVVYAAKDNGYGYSYIIVAHANGYVSVYGHISSILVKEGDVVQTGTIIGLSGGMPGTKGAGYMTTGPHLHFEMKLNGSFVDPLEHLPVERLQGEFFERLPEKYKLRAAVGVMR